MGTLMNVDVLAAQPPPPPPLPKFDPVPGSMGLLGLLAWCATACGVAGVIVIGIQMAIQMQRGIPGEGAGYMRGLVIVLCACVLAATAGPIVEFLGPFKL